MHKFIEDINSEIEVSKGRLTELCKPLGIKFKLYNNAFLLYADKVTSEFSKYTNGLIFENINGMWEIVCRPLPNLSRINYSEVEQTLSELKSDFCLQRIYDGIVINIYYSKLNNKWMFGTSHTNNIYDYKWRGIEYSSVIDNLNIDYSVLDKKTTYIYSVSDTRLHLFNGVNEHRLLATFSDTAYELQEQEEYTIEGVLQVINTNCANVIKNPVLKQGPCLGYVLRTSTLDDVIIPSKLWVKIEEMIYKPPFNKNPEIRKNIYDLYNDIDYIVVNNYIKNYKYASNLIHGFKDKFKQIFILENQLIKHITNKFKNIICIKNPIFNEYTYPYNLSIRDVKSYVYNNRNINTQFYYKLIKTVIN